MGLTTTTADCGSRAAAVVAPTAGEVAAAWGAARRPRPGAAETKPLATIGLACGLPPEVSPSADAEGASVGQPERQRVAAFGHLGEDLRHRDLLDVDAVG